MKRRWMAAVVAWGLAMQGCGDDGGDPAGHYLDTTNAAPRIEGPVLVDPAIETRLDPIWSESWVPIDNRNRDRQPSALLVHELAATRPGMRIADVGAGGGYFAFRWAAAVGPTGFVHAIDVDLRMTRKLSFERTARGVTNMDVTQVPRGTLGLASDSVDLVTFLDTGAFTRCEPERNDGYFRQAAEALHQGGRLLILNNAEVDGPGCDMPSPEEMITAASSRFTTVAHRTIQKGPWTAWVLLFERRPDAR